MRTTRGRPSALNRRQALVAGLALAGGGLGATAVPGQAPNVRRQRPAPLVFMASESGRPTYDQGHGGGNPFASALVAVLARPRLELGDLARDIVRETVTKSAGRQVADVPVLDAGSRLQPVAPGAGGARLALILVLSDYSGSTPGPILTLPSLAGAATDARRIRDACARAGFSTRLVLDPRPQGIGIRQALDRFSRPSAAADVALIYTTGHGVEVDGQVVLLHGDYPVAQGNSALGRHGTPLAEIAAAARARRINLVFYGGCRDNPFAS